MTSAINAILSPIIKIFALIKSFIVYRIRLDGLIATNFFELLKERGKMYSVSEEYVRVGLPRQYDAYAFYEGIPLMFSISERMLLAGMAGTDTVISITFFRGQKKRMFKVLDECNEKTRDEIPIFILRPWDSYKIGKLAGSKKADDPYLLSSQYELFESKVNSVTTDKKGKTGAILHGPAGNGKSYLVRYLAVKYKLPIYLITFEQDTDNANIIRMFSRIEGPCIVLFEDFDNHFDGRKPLVSGIKFSFDSILNSLDGVFTEHDGVVFVLTANNLSKIDSALKHRPSRFEFIIKVDSPSVKIRERIFKDVISDGLISKTEGYSLDMLLHMKDQLKAGETQSIVLENTNVFRGYLEEHRKWAKRDAERIKQEESNKGNVQTK